jgi:hypothetical protein
MSAPRGCRRPGSSWCSRSTMLLPSATGLSRRGGRWRRTSRTARGGLTDFRILDPAGYYLRIAGRAR